MCTVEAPDETAAGAVAVSLFDLEQRKRPVLGESRRDRSALHCAATVMAVTKCPIPAHTVARSQCRLQRRASVAAPGDWIVHFAGLMEKIMSKNTMQNSKASPRSPRA